MDFNEKLNLSMEYLHKQGAFLTAKVDDKVNTMTISWGSVGFMWGKPVFMALIRPQRYTNEFIEKSNSFTVRIPFSSDLKQALGVCGSKSGRNVDKENEAKINFISGKNEMFAIVDKCDVYYECKVLYSNKLKTEELPNDIKDSFYSAGDTHILYFAEIVNCYKGKDI